MIDKNKKNNFLASAVRIVFWANVLTDDALFYMQSRGINKREALLMLMFGFAHEVIRNIKVEALQERMDNLVMQRLKGELSRCASCMVRCDK